jgi:hypothetical protein
MEYYTVIKKNEIILYTEKWMIELKTIMLSEINQTEKDKYHIFFLMYRI